MQCVKCQADKAPTEFYAKDRTCKVCRCAMVRANQAAKRDHYQAYDRARATLPHRVKAREEYRQTQDGKVAVQRAHASYRSRHPERKAAANAVSNAIRDGHLDRWPCEVCGRTAEAHHPHYGAPLLVTWLCPTHHREAHRLIKQAPTLNTKSPNQPKGNL